MLFESVGSNADIVDVDEGNSVGNTQFSSAGTGLGPVNKAANGLVSMTYATGYLNGITLPVDRAYYGNRPLGLHTDNGNYLMVDGHVKWLRSSSVSPGNVAASATSNQTTGNGGASAAGTGGKFADNTTTPAVTFSTL